MFKLAYDFFGKQFFVYPLLILCVDLLASVALTFAQVDVWADDEIQEFCSTRLFSRDTQVMMSVCLAAAYTHVRVGLIL